jgi:hypothetical protein
MSILERQCKNVTVTTGLKVPQNITWYGHPGTGEFDRDGSFQGCSWIKIVGGVVQNQIAYRRYVILLHFKPCLTMRNDRHQR